MHELSIAYSLVETATAAARNNEIDHVDVVRLRLGLLSGVCKDSLLFAYEIATESTLLMGSTLMIEELPVVVLCPQCDQAQTLPNTQYLCCPVCETPASQIIQGKEIELTSITSHDKRTHH